MDCIGQMWEVKYGAGVLRVDPLLRIIHKLFQLGNMRVWCLVFGNLKDLDREEWKQTQLKIFCLALG